jgi:hypothetical protein
MEQSVPKRRHIKFRRRGITQKKAYNNEYDILKDNLNVMLSNFLSSISKLRGHAVAQLVEAWRYKSEGRVFDSQWCHWIFH